jgi:hypothetical protein
MAETVKTPLHMTAREFVTAIDLMAGAARMDVPVGSSAALRLVAIRSSYGRRRWDGMVPK